MHDIEGLANKQSESSEGDYSEWLGALKEAINCNELLNLNQDAFLLLLENTSRPYAFSAVFRLMSRMLENEDRDELPYNGLIEYVDESAYELSEWIDAIGTIIKWAEEKGLCLNFSDVLGYIACVSEQEGACVGVSLASCVRDMLGQYGFERARA